MSAVTEEELAAKAVAPRVTKEGLEANIKGHYCFNVLKVLEAHNASNPDNQMPLMPELGTLTLAVLVLNNGYTVLGKSACADPSNYNADIGNRLAIEDAKRDIWPLMGYALREELHTKGDGTFLDRMKREAHELENKYVKAQAFIGTPTFNALDVEERQLLLVQRDAMGEYLEALTQRITRAEAK